jgi:hypothetical protein
MPKVAPKGATFFVPVQPDYFSSKKTILNIQNGFIAKP